MTDEEKPKALELLGHFRTSIEVCEKRGFQPAYFDYDGAAKFYWVNAKGEKREFTGGVAEYSKAVVSEALDIFNALRSDRQQQELRRSPFE